MVNRGRLGRMDGPSLLGIRRPGGHFPDRYYCKMLSPKASLFNKEPDAVELLDSTSVGFRTRHGERSASEQ